MEKHISDRQETSSRVTGKLTLKKKSKLNSKALYEALNSIKNDLHLSDAQIGRFLRIPATTINTWLNKKRVPFKSSSNDIDRLIDFISIHRCLSAFFDSSVARVEWLNTFRDDLNAVPREMMEGSFEDFLTVRSYLDYMRVRGA